MAVTFVGAGALAGNATQASQSISSHASTAVGDILICQLINKSVTANAFSPPDGTWTAVITTEVNDCTTAADDHQYGLYWKRATAAGAQSFTFTKAVDDNVLFAGVISAWRGAKSTGSPLDATAAARTETAGAADNVSFPAYDPTSTSVHVIYMAYYGNDLTTFAAAMSADTNPDCTTRYDLESSTGNDCSLACTSGDNDGSNVAARTWASASSADAGNTGVVFALVAANDVTTTGETGAFTLTGQASLRTTRMPAAAGSFALTGQTVSPSFSYPAGKGTFVLTGQDADLREEAGDTPNVVAEVGAFALTGQAATFTTRLNAAVGSFALTGQAVVPTFRYPEAAGSFALTGQDVIFRNAIAMVAEKGTFTLTGQATTSTTRLSAGTGSFALTGQAATFTTRAPVGAGAFALTGQDAIFRNAIAMTAGAGAFTLTGQVATFTARAPAAAGTFTLSGQAALFTTRLPFGLGAFVLTGQDADLINNTPAGVAAETGSFILGGQTVTLTNTTPPVVAPVVSASGGHVSHTPSPQWAIFSQRIRWHLREEDEGLWHLVEHSMIEALSRNPRFPKSKPYLAALELVDLLRRTRKQKASDSQIRQGLQTLVDAHQWQINYTHAFMKTIEKVIQT